MEIKLNGEKITYDGEKTFMELAKEYDKSEKDEVILVRANGRLRELTKMPKEGDEVEFVTTADIDGNKTYIRGLILLLLKSISTVLGPEGSKHVHIDHKVSCGIYGEIDGMVLSEKNIEDIKTTMKKLVEEDVPFNKKSINTDDAIALFHKYGMYDKEKLFKYRRTSKTNIYNFAGFEDYFYGYMPPTAGMLKLFDLVKYDKGFMLMAPNPGNPNELPEFTDRPKFFKTVCESAEWGKTMNIRTVAEMNEVLVRSELRDVILMQEAFMEHKIGEIAAQIKERKGVKFVMIAGPSSSGKTTFSHRLSIQLKTLGMTPHPIPVDDYFRNREDTPKHPDGSYNFECLGAIDVEQFNDDMSALLRGERVEMPSFNFKLGVREYKGNFKQLGPDDVLVIEGIHCLNDALSYRLPKESKYKIYISALTQLNIDEHNRIPTTDGRLLRRIVRDARTRGASASATIRMWPSVRKGEEENIFPFQESADAMVNSALIYEVTVLKQFAEPLLFSVDRNSPEYAEAKRLLKFLDYFLGASSEDVPKNSILREFIGGSYFPV